MVCHASWFELLSAPAETGVRYVAHQRHAQAPQLVIVRPRRVRREGRDAHALRAEVRHAGLRIGILHCAVVRMSSDCVAGMLVYLAQKQAKSTSVYCVAVPNCYMILSHLNPQGLARGYDPT